MISRFLPERRAEVRAQLNKMTTLEIEGMFRAVIVVSEREEWDGRAQLFNRVMQALALLSKKEVNGGLGSTNPARGD